MKTRKYIYTTLATCLFVFSSCQFGHYPDKTVAAVQTFQALMQEILHYYAAGGLYKNSPPMK